MENIVHIMQNDNKRCQLKSELNISEERAQSVRTGYRKSLTA